MERRGAEARKHVNADDGAECPDELAGGGGCDVRQVDFGKRCRADSEGWLSSGPEFKPITLG
jgi:hypothetical protein